MKCCRNVDSVHLSDLQGHDEKTTYSVEFKSQNFYASETML